MSDRLNGDIDELALRCIDWRNARKSGITPIRLRADIVASMLTITEHKRDKPPTWFKEVLKDVEQLGRETE
jgi:hypothetical protein